VPDETYFVRWRGEVKGPFSRDALKRMAELNQLSKLHEVSADQSHWSRADKIEGVFPEYRRKVIHEDRPVTSAENATTPAEPLTDNVAVSEDSWFYSTGGQVSGPCSSVVILKLLSEGMLKRSDYVSPASNPSEWRPIERVPQFSSCVPSAPSQAQVGIMKEHVIVGIRCPFCNHEGPPTITKGISGGGWVLFIILLLFCIPLCWLPFVMDGCKDETRKCSSCGSKIG